MPALVEPVKIEGLRDVQAALKAIDGQAQKGLRAALNVAADIVVAGARRRVPTRTGAAQSSVRAASGQREASVKAGSKRAPYYGWLDYGGRVGPARSVHRPYKTTGRFIYPAYAAAQPRVLEALQTELADAVRAAGLEAH